MSQKMLAEFYGVEVLNIADDLLKLFTDAELSKKTSIKELVALQSRDQAMFW